MAIEFKDYYKILCVPRSANSDEIRKAFRRLARECHPDVAKNKATAESRFKDINEAYEVLGDAQKRKQYDALGSNWRPGAEFRPPTGWNHSTWQNGSNRQRGAGFEFQFGGTGFSDFFEQIFGAMGGRRADFNRPSSAGPQTSEKGENVESDILVSLHEALHGSIRPITLQRRIGCDKCRGLGHVQHRVCAACRGDGQIVRTEKYQVKVPAGVRDGQRLRLPGQGDPGNARGSARDLYLRVRFEKHSHFRVEETNIVHDLDLAPWEAVLGAQISVPTLDGRIGIRIPAGSQTGQRLRIRAHGLPDKDGVRGDMFVVLRIQVPETTTESERVLWTKLARESQFLRRS